MLKKLYECDRCKSREEEPPHDRNWQHVLILDMHHLERENWSWLCPDCSRALKQFLSNQ